MRSWPRLGLEGGRVCADGLQPGCDDGAVHRPASCCRATRYPGVLRGAGGARDPGRGTRQPRTVLLVHGEADDVVPVQRSRDAEMALRAANVPVEAVYVPRLGHGIDDTGLAMGALALQRAFAGG